MQLIVTDEEQMKNHLEHRKKPLTFANPLESYVYV